MYEIKKKLELVEENSTPNGNHKLKKKPQKPNKIDK